MLMRGEKTLKFTRKLFKQVALQADHNGQDVGIFLSGRDRILVVKGYMDSLAAQFGNGTALADEGYELRHRS